MKFYQKVVVQLQILKHQRHKVKNESSSNLSNEDSQAIKKLEDYLSKGYLTKEEFEKKKNEILSKSGNNSKSESPSYQTKSEPPKVQTKNESSGSNLSNEDSQAIKKLEEYLSKGYLTKEEFEKKKNEILSKSGGSTPNSQTPKSQTKNESSGSNLSNEDSQAIKKF